MYSRDKDARHTNSISSVPRQYERQVKRSKTSSSINTDEAEHGFDSKNEIDPRFDNIFTGAHWRLLSPSGQCCDVYGLQDNFKGIEDVPIVRLDTVICNKHGRVHILVFNQAL